MIFILSRSIEFLFFCILALNLSKCWQANVFSLGIQGFYLISSYAVVLLSLFISDVIRIDSDRANLLFLFSSVIMAGFLTMGMSKLFFRIFKKLKDDYFAIASLAFAEILIILASNIDLVGGARGITISNTFFLQSAVSNKLFYFALMCVVFAFCLARLVRQNRSLEGLVIKALSDDELGTQHLGINTQNIRETVFTKCGFWVGISGAIMTHYFVTIAPENFSFLTSIPILLFVVIGNYSLFRTVFLSLLIYSVYELFKINFAGLISTALGNFLSNIQGVFYGVLLIASVQYIFGKKSKKYGQRY